MIKIDLHVHSTFSDGTYTPDEIASLAHRRGVAIVALTDHDTIDGVQNFFAACAKTSVKPIAGIELSADAPYTTHILGYRIKDLHTMKQAMDHIVSKRDERNLKIIEKLNALGMDITIEDVRAEAGEKIVARPHFAAAMLKKGFIKTSREAFDRYLAKGCPAYAARELYDPRRCIELIIECGGLPALAHPSQTRLVGIDLDDLISELKSFGLWGLECYSSHNTGEQTFVYLSAAAKHSLFATAGSDFHGINRPSVSLGVAIPEDMLPWARLGVCL